MTNKSIARTLTETSALIELTGGNTFRARAFANAGRTIERMDEQVIDLLERNELDDVRGIGKGLTAQIREIVETGSFEVRDDLLGSIPPGVLEMLRVKGIGAKKARTAWQSENITSIDDLEVAAETGRLAGLPGFGAKTQEKVLAAVRSYQRYRTSRRYATVIRELRELIDRLPNLAGVERVSLTGSVRRCAETVTSADILLGGDVETIGSSLADLLPESSIQSVDGLATLVSELPDGLPLRVYLCPRSRFGSELWRTTGSAEFIETWINAFGEPGEAESEEDVFARTGIPVIAPELRENRGEIDAARTDTHPQLIRANDLRGSLHNHSTYSDGAHSLAQMAETARAMGREYFGICDHSRSLTIANGLPIERVEVQQAEIRSLNEGYERDGHAFRILSGIESDILKDGSLDYPSEVLASFDFVVASVHSGFAMTQEEATDRIIRAIENPYTSILGHMTGRLLLTRDGYPVDHIRIIDACARHDVAIELNANPHRLDMDWRFIREATERGVLISINPDAHSTDELLFDSLWGIPVARKGWLEPSQCLNAKTLSDFTRWLDDRRR